MVHALERAGRHLAPDSRLVLLQPHRTRRPFIAVRDGGRRVPICALINPVFQPLIETANSSIQTVIERGLFSMLGRTDHSFRVRLANPTQLRRYLHTGVRPPRFPPGGKQRLLGVWRSTSRAEIEVTEFLTVVALRSRRF
ncbi:MAG TPA: hypothetical protein VHO95_10235 [Candidatus Dormibacteraeota bacterium]|nr:hypothetical protein [Candidatus Dormibacteraeota bacterium]HEX2680474.1 hypothetical protein [Candidatus Dormibacteraeota bacterium]